MDSQSLKKLLYRQLVLVVFCPLLVLVFVLVAIHSADIRHEINRENSALSTAISSEIHAILNEPLTLLMAGRDAWQRRELLKETGIEIYLNSTVRSSLFFEAVSIISSDGRILLTGLPPGRRGKATESVGINPVSREAINQARKTGGITWSDVYESSLSGGPVVTVALPAGNEVIAGCLVLDQLAGIALRLGNENRFSLAIIDRKGQVIAHTRRDLVRNKTSFADLGIVRQALQGESGASDFTFQGRQFIANIAAIPGTGWLVMVAQDAAHAYLPIYRMLGVLFGGLLISIGLVAFLASRSISRVLTPLSALVENTKAIAEGEYHDFSPSHIYREVDDLEQNFRRMAIAVKSREDDLQERNEELMTMEEELRQHLDENLRYQEELVMASERLENILESFGDGFFSVDSAFQLTYFNRRAEELLGRLRTAVVGNNFWEMFPDFIGTVFYDTLNEALESRQPVIMSALYAPAGIWLEVRCYPFKNGLSIFFRDVSEMRNAEQQLAHSREFYLKLFEESPLLIWRADAGGMCNYFNRTWLEFTGLTLEQSTGDRWSTAVHPDDRSASLETWRRAFLAREPFCMEHRLRYNDGSFRWIINYGRPFNDLNDLFAGFIGTCYDISQRKNLEEQLLHSQRMESIGTLAGGVAHDFNNILTVIIGCADMSLTCLGGNKTAEHYVGQIVAAANRAAGLTQSLLAFSRKQVMEVAPVDLNGIVAGLETMLRRIVREDITVEVSICGTPLSIMADAAQLEQVIMNMVANARDAMPQGGLLCIATMRVETDFPSLDGSETVETRPCAAFMISDTGTGMDHPTLERIFDPFYTTKDIGRGTGLGLSMAYGIIKQHKGKIDVVTAPGSGTSFTVYIPLAEMATPAKKETTASNNLRGNETILVVEDDSYVRDADKAILEYAGYRVVTANNGEEAVQLFKQSPEHFDLVLMDVIMPVMNGMEASEQIIAVRHDIPVIFTSGYIAELQSMEEVNELASKLLQKPISPEALLVAIRSVLDRRAS